MKEAGFTFEVRKPDVEEDFPATMQSEKVPGFLAQKKADAFAQSTIDEIIVTADTVVIIDGRILNKPADRREAISMLSTLSGATHTVITGVCITHQWRSDRFDEITRVTFRKLSDDDIAFYVDNFQPFDKAGSYGAQDCLPANFNPCSIEEMQFLKDIGKPDLAARTFTRTDADKGLPAIDKIEGSYFNVMGLPVHQVHRRLSTFS